jgi:hypothetical protein
MKLRLLSLDGDTADREPRRRRRDRNAAGALRFHDRHARTQIRLSLGSLKRRLRSSRNPSRKSDQMLIIVQTLSRTSRATEGLHFSQ